MTDKAEALKEIITLLAVPPISNLHRQAASMLTAQAAEIATLRGRVAKFEDYYKHYHKANYVTRGDEDFLTDDCDECPFDLRDPVHIRSQP